MKKKRKKKERKKKIPFGEPSTNSPSVSPYSPCLDPTFHTPCKMKFVRGTFYEGMYRYLARYEITIDEGTTEGCTCPVRPVLHLHGFLSYPVISKVSYSIMVYATQHL